MIYVRDVVFDRKWSFLSTENPSAQGELKPIISPSSVKVADMTRLKSFSSPSISELSRAYCTGKGLRDAHQILGNHSNQAMTRTIDVRNKKK